MDGLTFIGAGLFALAGVWLGQWLNRKQLKEAADERRRDEAAAVLAPIKALVVDADPLRLTMHNAQQHWENDMPRLVEEWRSGREALLKLSISHPSGQVRELAEGCEKALFRSMSTASMFLDDVVTRKSSLEMHDRAIKDHEEATGYIERLAEAIRS